MTHRPIFNHNSCIMVAVKTASTIRTVVPSFMQLFWYFFTTTRTILWSIVGTYGHHQQTRIYGFVCQYRLLLDHPASNTDLASFVRASPLTFKSSTATTSYFFKISLAVLKWKSLRLSATFLWHFPSCLTAFCLRLLPFLRRETRFWMVRRRWEHPAF